jgi:hypothetical protein
MARGVVEVYSGTSTRRKKKSPSLKKAWYVTCASAMLGKKQIDAMGRHNQFMLA